MPNLPNAKKALRKSTKREKHNRGYKNRVKRIARSIDDTLKAGNKKEAEKLLPVYFKAIDKAAKRNIIHKNTSARRKSLYAKKVAGNQDLAEDVPKIAADKSSQAK